MIESLEASKSSLNRSHSSLETLPKGTNVSEVVLRAITSEMGQQIRVGMSDYPRYQRIDIRNRSPFRATVITSGLETVSDRPKTSVFFLPGFGGTAAGTAHIAADLYREIPGYLDREQLGMVASLSSSIGVDQQKSSFPQSHLERAISQAILITELLKKNPSDEVFIIAHSLAGMEVAYMLPMLKSLLRQNDLSTKIGGIVLLQSGGLYPQGAVEFAGSRKNRVIGFEDEIVEMFPSVFDKQRVLDKLEKAQTEQDAGKILRAKEELSEINQKRENPPNLTDNDKTILEQIDSKLESAENADGHLTKQLLKQRNKLLLPVIKRILKSADKRDKFGPSFPQLLQFLSANFLPGRSGLTTPLPESTMQALSNIPIALVFGENDGYFKLKEYLSHKVNEKIKGKKQFPNAEKLFVAEVSGWPHIAPATNTAKLASIMGDIFRRMKNSTTTSGEITDLKY